MDMKNMLKREGREAKNLVLYQINQPDRSSSSTNESHRKPPSVPRNSASKSNNSTPSNQKSGPPRVRSASTGRDKKSELQARYWALLFGNLQRAINEIYQTVECYENMSSCQETILVLENYIRDFKALAEWFRVSWDYESTPTPQRPQSLAWEIRKTNPTPRLRSKSHSSSSSVLSDKSSPCISGKSSPCLTIEENKVAQLKAISDKKLIGDINKSIRASRAIRELFLSKPLKMIEEPTGSHSGTVSSNDLSSQNINKPKTASYSQTDTDYDNIVQRQFAAIIRKCNAECQTDLEDDNLTLAEIREKLSKMEIPETTHITLSQENTNDVVILPVISVDVPEAPAAVSPPIKSTVLLVQSLDDMESAFLTNQSAVKISESDSLKPPEELTSKDKVEQPIETDLGGTVNQSDIITCETLDKTETETESIVQATSNTIIPQPTVVPVSIKSEETVKEVKPIIEAKKQVPLKYSSVLNRPIAVPVIVSKSASQPTIKTNVITGNKIVRQTNALSKCPTTSSITNGSVAQKRIQVRAVTTSNIIRNRNISNIPPNDQNKWNNKRLSVRDNHVPSNVANRLSARSKTMIEIKDGKRSSQMVVNRKPMMHNKGMTIVAENADDSKKSNGKTVTTDDGWLTVKARRRSGSHWANRFNQPTGYASLPTLALNTEDGEDTDDERSKKDEDLTHKRSKLEKKSSNESKNSARVGNSNPKKVKPLAVKTKSNDLVQKTPPINTNMATSNQSNLMKRQNSDLTGLKLTTLHREFIKNEKNRLKNEANSKITTENKNTSPKNSSTIEVNKVDMILQTNLCNDTSTVTPVAKELPENLIDCDEENILSPFCEESEDKDDIENDEDQRQLVQAEEEQENLERQIRELENTEIDVDTETDETDYEATLELDDVDCQTSESTVVQDSDMTLEVRYDSLFADMTWCERAEILATLEEIVSRHPGRAMELHQKLSSPSRRRSLHETLKKYQAKQARAQEKREQLQKEKSQKIQHLLARVEDVKQAKSQIIEKKRLKLEERLQRAAENRNQYLKDKIRKAHDEEEKLKEIAFIKNLEAQNKRLDFIESCKEQEVRLQDLELERLKKLEEKAAKEAAVERRRLELEQERQKKLEKMSKERKEREERVGKMQEEREQARQKIASQKARDREERLHALQVQQQQTTEELQRKIIQKQQESARRHEENIEHKRQRALELSIPNRNVDENGQKINNDGGDGDLSSTVSDVSREFSKLSKKRLKKLRLRMSQRAEEYKKELNPLPLHVKRESQVPKLLGLITRGGGAQGIERPLGQLLRLISKAEVNDFQCLWLLDGLETISKIIQTGMEANSDISRRAMIIAVQIYRNLCSICPQIAKHAILGNTITVLFDVLFLSLQTPEEKKPTYPVELSTELMLAATVTLSSSSASALKKTLPLVTERLPDVISYAVTIGLVDILSRRCLKIHESVEQHQSVVLSLLATLGLLTKMAEICPPENAGKRIDSTRFLSAVKSTELFGSISLLYSTIVPNGEMIPPRTISLAAAIFNLLVTVANLDIETFQEILSEESLSMKFLDVVTILIKYCGPKSSEKGETQAVIIDLIATLGFFCANNTTNQNLLIADQSQHIIKNLAKMPKSFNMVIYSTLVTIISDNEEAKKVIAKDFNVELLEEYKKSNVAKKNKLISILKPSNSVNNKSNTPTSTVK